MKRQVTKLWNHLLHQRKSFPLGCSGASQNTWMNLAPSCVLCLAEFSAIWRNSRWWSHPAPVNRTPYASPVLLRLWLCQTAWPLSHKGTFVGWSDIFSKHQKASDWPVYGSACWPAWLPWVHHCLNGEGKNYRGEANSWLKKKKRPNPFSLFIALPPSLSPR